MYITLYNWCNPLMAHTWSWQLNRWLCSDDRDPRMRIPISIEFVSTMQVSRTGPSVRLNSARIHNQNLRATFYFKQRSPGFMELHSLDIEETPYWIRLGCRKTPRNKISIPTTGISQLCRARNKRRGSSKRNLCSWGKQPLPCGRSGRSTNPVRKFGRHVIWFC